MRAMVVIGIIAMIVAAACGSSPPDPAAVYQDMGTRMASVTSFHTSVTIEGDEGSEQFEVDFVAPDRIRMTSVGEAWFAEVLGIGDRAYLKLPGFQGWFVEDEGTEGFGNLTGFFSALYTQASGLSYIGRETLEGISVHHLQGTQSGDVLRLVDIEDKDDSASADFWIGADDSLLYRVRTVGSPNGEVADMAFSAFDVPVTIEAPAKAVSADVLDGLGRRNVAPDALGELISMLTLEAQACLRDQLGEEAYNNLAAGFGSIGFEEEFAFGQCLADILGD